MKFTRLITAALTLGAIAVTASAQAFDDDIYFDASKATKKTSTVKKTQKVIRPAEFAAADTYAGELTSSTRDVDEYNRRGIFALPDSISVDSLATLSADNGDAFANTRRIERFYNPDVVVESKDPEVAQYYYSDRPAEINIYVSNPYWGWGGWYDPWYYGYYNPWYWGPSWSIGWGPSWSWGWSPAWGPSWGWGPSWNWGWTPGWGPSWGWGGGPNWGPVATRPEPPHGGNGAGSYRRANAASGARYSGGSYSGTSSGRRPAGAPSSASNWNINNVGTGTRPGSIANPGYRQGASGSRGGSVGTGTGLRPGNSNNATTTRRNNSSYTNRNNTNTNTNRTYNYNNNTNNSSRSNSSSFRTSGGGGGSFRNSGGSVGGMRGGGSGGRRR
ncbi:MAG: hypothetical protein K2K40_03725 [Paramuribaculum sp.]|nr:hypothetical protein [Paramuribaculum sp.]